MDRINPNNIASNASKEKEFDVGLFLKKLFSTWYYFLVSVIFCGVIAFLVIRYSTPIYKINAKVLINPDSKSMGGSAGDLMDISALMGIKSNVDNEAEVLKTRNLTRKVVQDIQLNATFYKVGSIRDVEVNSSPFILTKLDIPDSLIAIKIYFSKISNKDFSLTYTNPETSKEEIRKIKFGEYFTIKTVGNFRIDKNVNYKGDIEEEFYLDLKSVDEQVSILREAIVIGVTNSDVTTVDLSLNYPVPAKGENILAKLIENYVEQTIREKNRIADSTITFIDNRLFLVSQELSGIEGNIQSFKQDNKLADISEQSKQLVGQSTETIKQEAEIETQINIIDAITENLRNGIKNNRVIATSLLQIDPVFSSLVEKYNSRLIELERLSLVSTSNNPFVRSLEDQIDELKSAILSNLKENRKNLVIKKTQIINNSGKITGAIKKVPTQERIYLDLARQQQIKQELYIYLLQKREETAISKTSNISNSQTIDPPKAEYKPVSPKKIVVLGLAIIIGLILPLFRMIILDTLNRRIQSKEDITNNTSVPILGEISHSQSKDPLVLMKDSRSSIAEQFRALRTNIKFYLNDEAEKVILVTSSMPGEGKSFLSINVSNVLAITGKKVVIMELDLRKPKVSSQFNLDNKIGFSNYIITKNMTTDEIIKKSGVHENLFVICSGPIPPNPAELILHDRTKQLIAELKEKFDYVVIDSPPLGLVTDAQLLSTYTNLTLYVVRQKYTFKEHLQIPQDLFRSSKMSKIGIIVNDIETKSKYGYGYGYGYGRGYGHGYYSNDNENEPLLHKLKKKFGKSKS